MLVNGMEMAWKFNITNWRYNVKHINSSPVMFQTKNGNVTSTNHPPPQHPCWRRSGMDRPAARPSPLGVPGVRSHLPVASWCSWPEAIMEEASPALAGTIMVLDLRAISWSKSWSKYWRYPIDILFIDEFYHVLPRKMVIFYVPNVKRLETKEGVKKWKHGGWDDG